MNALIAGHPDRLWRRARQVFAGLALAWTVLLTTGLFATGSAAQAQDPPGREDRLSEAERRAAAALAGPQDPPPADAPVPAATNDVAPPNLFSLWWRGGPLMYPITFMSFVVALFTVERLLGLRRARVMPPALIAALADQSGKQGGLDPRQAYRVCQQFPSAAASVFRSVLLKVGRPHSEVEHTLVDASEREAARLYKNVRTINLATSISPLLGLLGTVQGMIECFYITANLPTGANRTESLANGIYIALVTTFGGLLVAIPASCIAHYFEGRIQSLFREIDEFLLGLMPQLERYEGKLRVSPNTLSAADERAESTANPRAVAPLPVPSGGRK